MVTRRSVGPPRQCLVWSWSRGGVNEGWKTQKNRPNERTRKKIKKASRSQIWARSLFIGNVNHVLPSNHTTQAVEDQILRLKTFAAVQISMLTSVKYALKSFGGSSSNFDLSYLSTPWQTHSLMHSSFFRVLDRPSLPVCHFHCFFLLYSTPRFKEGRPVGIPSVISRT